VRLKQRYQRGRRYVGGTKLATKSLVVFASLVSAGLTSNHSTVSDRDTYISLTGLSRSLR
jgi:hypothetical protein